MGAKFVAYEHVPPGFEMVIENKQVKAWSLWWNAKLTDDPEAWDSEIKLLNKMQDELGELTLDKRLIRAQMAEFCRLHPLFPRSIDILCKEIGTARFSSPIKMGCEGRGLLDSLGYHDSQSLNDQRKEILTEYALSLKKWLVQGRPENPTESKVFGFLGQQTNSKEAFVENIISVIDSEKPSISSLKKLSENECRKTHGKSIFETRTRPLICFNCEGSQEGASIHGCPHCCYSMILDTGLLCAGTFGDERSMFDEFRRFAEENILAYASAINSWLREAPPMPLKSMITARYIAEGTTLAIAERVHSSLGEKDEDKAWLTSCLLKTIKDNQRWHKRTELIDDFPESISWFKEKLQLIG